VKNQPARANRIVLSGTGQLADKAKREEYERLMRQKKNDRAKWTYNDKTGPHNTCCGDL